MSNLRIERWITTDEGNHLPIINGKISPEKHDKKVNEKAFVEGLTGDDGYELTSTAKFVKDGMLGAKNSAMDQYGNSYHLKDGNIYMEKSFYKSKYDTSKGWLPVDGAVGVDTYIAPGSKDYSKIKAKIDASEKATESSNKSKGARMVEFWKEKGFGGDSIKPSELYRRAKSEYGLKMPYLKFQKVGVDGIYKSLRDNKNAINDLKQFFNPKTDSKGNIYFSSYK